MFLTNCQTNHILICSTNCVISEGNKATACAITDTKLYVSVVTFINSR